MKDYLFRLGVFVLVVGIVVGFTAHAVARQELQILVHEGGDYLERTIKFWDAFQQANPDISIEIVPGPGSGTGTEKLALMVAAGIPPDLVRTYCTSIKFLGDAGLLQDITSRYQSLPASLRNDIWPVLIDNLSYRGRLYALPMGTVATLFFYNKQHFNEKGVSTPSLSWSWEREGISELKKFVVADSGGVINKWGLGAVGGDNFYPFIFSASKGLPLFNEDGTEFLGNRAETRYALEVLHDLAQVHRVMSISGGWTDFAEQRVSSLVWGSFMAGYFPRYENLDWDFALFPSLGEGRAAAVWPETPYGISVGAKNPELAWRALEFIVSDEGQRYAIELGWGVPPARRSMTVSAFMQYFRGKNIDAVAQMLSLPHNQPLPIQVTSDVTNVLKEAFRAVVLGQKAPGQALDEVTPAIMALIQEE
ncbi:MAG: extracellular solute-binding protein [Firmicutes bacterium]|jgi:multiple sugar transport system substrate-binding protein|nr:extracellular solute-binding protein [Bacillota bacterium]